MQFIQTAAYDPIFWLHHSYVDKVWAERQDNQHLQPLTHSELPDTVLRPFQGKLIHSPQECLVWVKKCCHIWLDQNFEPSLLTNKL